MGTKTITPDSSVQRNPDIVHSSIDGEVVMMNLDQGAYFGLDKVGSSIWNLLETPKTVNELCQSLMSAYEVEEERCFQEVVDFLHQIHSHKMLLVEG